MKGKILSSSVIMVRPTVSPPSSASAPRPIPNGDYDPMLNTPDADSEGEKAISVPIHGLAKYGRNAAIGVVGFVLALATWEVILQLTVESRRGASEHPSLGRIENPGWILHTREGYSRTRLNSLGMRTLEPTAKQPGDYRILVLGDSFTRADEVADGVNFSDRLQVALNESAAWQNQSPSKDASITQDEPITQPQPSVQVINAGKPSASPASYLYAADFHNQTFEPDSTVIQLSDSDFREDMNSAISEFYVASSEPSALESSGDYELLRNETFGSVDPLAQAVVKYAPPLRSLMQMSALRVGGRNLHGSVSPAGELSEGASDSDNLQALQVEDAALVSWTLKQLKQKFPNVVLVYLPAVNYQDAGAVSSDPRNAALESALEQTAAQEGIPLLNMRSDFLAYFRSQGSYLKGFHNTVPGQGHLNETGHELVAQRLIDFYQGLESFTGGSAEGGAMLSVPFSNSQTSSALSLSKSNQSHEESSSSL